MNHKYVNRDEAGSALAARLMKYADQPDTIVLGLARGGIPVAFKVAAMLNAPLDTLLVRKIGTPDNPELAAGAVIDGEEPEIFLNEDVMRSFRVPEKYLEEEKAHQLAEIERRRALYDKERHSYKVDIQNKTVIVVDDGVATGATIKAALKYIKNKKPDELILATPVAAYSTLKALREEADEVVCPMAPKNLASVGQYYENFPQVNDEEVIECLQKAEELRLKADYDVSEKNLPAHVPRVF